MDNGPKGFQRLRPVGYRIENEYDWRRLIWPADSLHFSRRLFLKSPALAALSLTAVRSAAETLKASERLSITREFHDGPISVQLESIFTHASPDQAEPEAGPSDSPPLGPSTKADSQAPVWLLDPAAFGPKARLDFRMNGTDGSAAIYVLGMRYGALSGGWLIFRFRRVSDPDKLDRWYISIDTNMWDPTSSSGSQASDQVRLLFFLQGSANARLVQSVRLAQLSKTLPNCFNGLLNFKADSIGGTDQIPISYDRDGIWRLENLPPRLLEGAAPGIFATGLSMCMAEEQNDTGSRRIFHGCLDIGAGHAGECCDAQVLANTLHSAAEQPSSVGWNITISHQQERDGSADFVLSALPSNAIGKRKPFVLFRAQDIRLGEDIPTSVVVRAEAVVFALWSFHMTLETQPLLELRELPGTLLRRRDVPLLLTVAMKNPQDEVIFAAAPSLNRDPFHVRTPAGHMQLGWPSPTLPASDGGGEVSEDPLVTMMYDEPFSVISDSPVLLHSSRFGTGSFEPRTAFDLQDSQGGTRSVNWFEARLLLDQSDLSLPDADYSRLDFNGTDLTFLFNPTPVAGFPRNYVWLGPDGVSDAAPERARIDLSRAALAVCRYRDLASATFRFERLFLLVPKDPASAKPRIVPEGPQCGIFEHPEPDPNAVSGAAPANGRIGDSRPVLSMQLPPQHILEQSFFRREIRVLPDVQFEVKADEAEEVPNEYRAKVVLSGKTIWADCRKPTDIERKLRQIAADLDITAAFKTEKLVELRKAIRAIKSNPNLASGEQTYLLPQIEAFSSFAKKFHDEAERLGLPRDQRQYVGPFALDPDLVSIGRDILADLDITASYEALKSVFRSVDSQFELLLELTKSEKTTPAGLTAEQLNVLSKIRAKKANEPNIVITRHELLALEPWLESSSPTYLLFRSFFREKQREAWANGKGAKAGISVDDEQFAFILPAFKKFDTFPTRPKGAAAFRSDLYVRWSSADAQRAFLDAFLKCLDEFAKGAGGIEPYVSTAEARLSQPSRLAFRINCRDSLTDQRNAASLRRALPEGVRGVDGFENRQVFSPGISEIPFTFAGLTDWGGMELAVTPRARQVFSPEPGGRLDQNAARRINLNGAAMLDRLGFSPGTDPTEREWRFRAGKIVESLRQRPSQMETAIDLPARLTLSPSQQAIFLAPHGINPGIFNLLADGTAAEPLATPVDQDETGVPLTRVPSSCPELTAAHALWSVDLLTRPGDPKPGLRAVHSPDLSPNVLMKLYAQELDTDIFAPMRGPEAPWYMSRSDTGQADEDPLIYAKGTLRAQGAYWDFPAEVPTAEADAPQAEGLQTPATDAPTKGVTPFLDFPTNSADACARLNEPDKHRDLLAMLPGRFRDLCRKFTRRRTPPAKFRTSMDAYDRHELVLLSSAYGLPVAPRSGGGSKTTSLAQETQFKPDARYELIDVMPDQEIYVPQPLNVSLLSLTALGGSLVHDTGFAPPASARHGRDGANLFDALSIERWQYAAFLGRDIYCEVVYKGYLCPLGVPASLVKITERVIVPEEKGRGGVTNANRGRYTAFLRQRMFIRVGQPEKSFPSLGQPLEGRRMPCSSLLVLTRTTPDIIDPTTVGFEVNSDPESAPQEHASGRILFNQRPGLVFWPRTHFSAKGDVRFEMLLDDGYASLPLLFVDNVAANDPQTLTDLTAYYNCEGLKGKLGVKSPDIAPEALARQPANLPAGAVPQGAATTATRAPPSSTDAAVPIVPEIHRRTLIFNGAPLRYADEKRSNDCTLETIALTLRMEGRSTSKTEPCLMGVIPVYDFDHDRMVFDGALRIEDQPPFYPAMESTRILLSSNAQLTGSRAEPRRAVYDGDYLANGFHPTKGDAGDSLPEVFLNLIDDEPQDQGDRGDQSGGVFRPQGTLRMISRDKGPLAGRVALTTISYQSGRVPSLKSTLTQKPVPKTCQQDPVNRQIGEVQGSSGTIDPASPAQEGMLKDIFGDAKLLGMVSLSTLVSTIAKIPGVLDKKNAPNLKQTVDYGISLADPGAQEAGLAAGNFADMARREVLVPLRDLVTEAKTRWDALDADLNARQKAANPVDQIVIPVKLDELFPEIDAGLIELDQALTTAIETEDVLALATALSSVYEAGRRFIAALGRATSEVVERFEIALSARFEALRGPLTRLMELVDGNIGPLLEAIKVQAIAAIPRLIVPGPDDSSRVAVLVLPNPLRSTLGSEEATALQKALTLTKNDVVDIARELIREILTNAINGQELFSDNVLRPLNRLILDRKKAAKDVISRFAENKRVQALTELAEYTVLAEWLLSERQLKRVIAGDFDGLHKQAKVDINDLLESLKEELGADAAALQDSLNVAKAMIEARLISVLSLVMGEIAPYLLYVQTAEQRWKAVEESLSGTDLLKITQSIEALLSHLLQRRIALVESVVGTKITEGAAAIGKYIRGLDVGALALVSATGPYPADAMGDYPWVYVEAKQISRIARREITAQGEISGEPLQTLIDALNELILASEGWLNFSVGENPNNDSDLEKLKVWVSVHAERLEQARTKIDALFLAGYNALWSLICDIVNDAYALVGLKSRIDEIANDVTNLNLNALAGVEELRRDLKRIAAARLQAFERNIRCVERLQGALARALEDDTVQFFAELNVVISTISNDDENKAKIAGAKLARQTGGMLRWLVARLMSGLVQIQSLGVGGPGPIVELRSNPELAGLLRSLDLFDMISDLTDSLQTAGNSVAGTHAALELLPKPKTTGPVTSSNYPDVLDDERLWLEALAKQKASISSLGNSLKAVKEELFKVMSAEDIPQKFLSALTLRAQEAINTKLDGIATQMLKATKISEVYEEAVDDRARLMPNPEDPIAAVLGPVLVVEMRPDDPRMNILQHNGHELYAPPTGQTFTIKNDMLVADAAYLAEAVRVGKPISDERFRTFLQVFVVDWSRGRSAPAVILAAIGDAVRRLLRGDINLDDLFNIREQIEAKLLDLVPTKRKFEYTLDFPLPQGPVEEATLGFLVPGEDCRLDVGAVTEIDLLPNGPQGDDPAIRPSIRASTLATLGPFDIKLVGKFFDALTIKFAGAEFSSDLGGEANFKAFYTDVVIGKQLQFLEELSTYLSPGNGSGAFVDILRDGPGIEAGYKLDLGTIMLGNIIFANVGLFVSAEIPFDNRPALFKASLGRRDAMFSISYAPFGGEGFFAVVANVEKIIGFEMALGFGAIVPFKIGALTGIGRVTSGFYIRKMALEDGRDVTEISATCFVGGACKISIFSLCASLSVRMTQDESGAMSGIAIFTYSFSLGLVDFDFTIRFSKTEKKGFAKKNDSKQAALWGRRRFAETGRSPIRIAQLTKSAHPPRISETPKIQDKTISPFLDWSGSQRHLSRVQPTEDLLW